jgi:cysteine synthase B
MNPDLRELRTMYKTIEDTVGNTPLVRLQRLPGTTTNAVLAKLEGNNPAGSVKDRPAVSMIVEAEKRGQIKPGDTLIEATSGNTGIALAMAAAMRGYRMVLVMPEHLSMERRQTMRAFGAEIVLTSKAGGMESARDIAEKMRAEGQWIILDQFANPDNPLSHYRGTGPEIWHPTAGSPFRVEHGHDRHDHGCGTVLMRGTGDRSSAANRRGSQIRHTQVAGGASAEKIYDAKRVDRGTVLQADAEEMARRLARARDHLRRHFVGRRARSRRIARDAGERDHRVHRLRPRRPLLPHRRLPLFALIAPRVAARASKMTPTLVFDIERSWTSRDFAVCIDCLRPL